MKFHETENFDYDKDIESEAGHSKEQKEATLRKRIKMIKSSIENLTKASAMCKYVFLIQYRVI